MAKTYTLLIWEEIPESTKLVLIPNDTLDASDIDALRKSNGKFINHDVYPDDVRDALNCLSDALCSKAEHLSDKNPAGSKWALRWKDCIQDDAKPIEGKPITTVFLSGFCL